MENVLRIGSVGSSTVSDVMQEAIRLTDGVTCSVVYSRTQERAKAYAQQVGAAGYCTDYEAFVSRDDVDVVYIASPNSLHTRQALLALEHKKHVIIEKPTALTRGDVTLLHDTAVKNGVYILEAITTLFMPNYIACKELMPSLGKITRACIKYGQYSSKLDDYKRGIISNSLNPQMKGGALYDMGIYCIHVAVDLFGIPREVAYEPIYGPNGVDLEGTLTLTYPDLTVDVQTSKQRAIGSICRIEGEHGYFEETGPVNDFVTCHAQINNQPLQIALQGSENRMIYELSRFRDAILHKDDALFQRMYHQSLAATGILEDAHKDMAF